MVVLSSKSFQKKDTNSSLTQIINQITAESFMNQAINTTVENTILKNGHIGYIQVNDTIVSCGFGEEDTVKSNSKYKTMHLHTFSTDTNHRGNGYCEKLVKEFIKNFSKTHILYLSVRTENGNENLSAIRCYENCGFIMLPSVYRDHYDGKNSCMIRIPNNTSKKKKSSKRKR
jgi:ribosomal protein S18 acetylase RimI-like enzyme